MSFRQEYPSEENITTPPSFVDVVFILLIFFLVLSVLGIGIVETGEHSQDIYDNEQELADFPSVKSALHRDMTDYLILDLDMDENGPQYFVFSNVMYYDKVIVSMQEYETFRSAIQSGATIFESAPLGKQEDILQQGWGPFHSAEAMRLSEVVSRVSESNLIIQANERFTYHQILEVMSLFDQFESVYFEVIENSNES